jgi:hypothetical protein
MDIMGTVTEGINILSKGILIFLIVGVIVGIIIIVVYIKSFKHTIILKSLAKNRKIISETKWKEFIDNDGIPFLRTLKKVGGRKLHPIAPPEAIEIRETGKKFVEAYVTETGEIHYIRDKGFIENDTSKLLEAFTTKQRSILINQHKKALERKGKSWTELIIPIVGIAALVIMVVSLLIFYDNMAQPLLSMADKQINYEAQVTRQMEIQERMNRNIQTIASHVGADISENPPN